MNFLSKSIAATAILFSFNMVAVAQNDPLANFDGIWVSVNPPGPHVTFGQVGLGKREASLPFGQSVISVSGGEAGSNLKVIGSGFECYYFVGFINPKEMTWELKQGDPICLKSAHYKKDPP